MRRRTSAGNRIRAFGPAAALGILTGCSVIRNCPAGRHSAVSRSSDGVPVTRALPGVDQRGQRYDKNPLEHDPEKWAPVFGKGLPPRKRGSCSTDNLERDDES